jgi:hypothetical protein
MISYQEWGKGGLVAGAAAQASSHALLLMLLFVADALCRNGIAQRRGESRKMAPEIAAIQRRGGDRS